MTMVTFKKRFLLKKNMHFTTFCTCKVENLCCSNLLRNPRIKGLTHVIDKNPPIHQNLALSPGPNRDFLAVLDTAGRSVSCGVLIQDNKIINNVYNDRSGKTLYHLYYLFKSNFS